MSLPARAGVAALVSVAGLAVSGCMGSTAYGPVGRKNGFYGYSDSPIEGGGHSIRVSLPYHVKDPQLAYAYFDRRAEELCNGAIARKQIHTAQQAVLPQYNRLNGIVGDYYLEGYVWCGARSEAAAAPADAAPAPAAS